MQRLIVCKACPASHIIMPIFEYHSPMHTKRKSKARILLLYIVIVKTFFLGGGGGSFPPAPPVDETLNYTQYSRPSFIRTAVARRFQKPCG